MIRVYFYIDRVKIGAQTAYFDERHARLCAETLRTKSQLGTGEEHLRFSTTFLRQQERRKRERSWKQPPRATSSNCTARMKRSISLQVAKDLSLRAIVVFDLSFDFKNSSVLVELDGREVIT